MIPPNITVHNVTDFGITKPELLTNPDGSQFEVRTLIPRDKDGNQLLVINLFSPSIFPSTPNIITTDAH